MAGKIASRRKQGHLVVVAGLTVLLALWPGESLAGRKGIEIKVMLVDGGRVNGELIAVRADAVIVKSAIIESTVAFADIESIVVPEGVVGSVWPRQLGLYAGIALGVVAAGAYGRWYSDKHDGYAFWALPIGVVGGAWLGEAAGGWLSGKEGKDKLYRIKGQSPEAVARIMAKLKRKARLRTVR